MAVDGSGGLLATASADKSAKVWDIQGGFCTHSFTGHRSDAQHASSKQCGSLRNAAATFGLLNEHARS